MMIRFSLFLLVIPMICIGCNVRNIDVDDNVSFSNLEASLLLTENDHLRIRMRGSKASGEYSQTVSAGDLIRIENTPIFGPVEINGTTDVTYFSLAIGREFTGGEFGSKETRIINYIGVAQTNLDFTLRDAGTTYRVDDSTTELYLQYGLAYAISDSVELGFTLATSSDFDGSGMNELDLNLHYKLLKQLRITGGYRWFEYSYGAKQEDSNDSEISVDFTGPFIGLDFPF